MFHRVAKNDARKGLGQTANPLTCESAEVRILFQITEGSMGSVMFLSKRVTPLASFCRAVTGSSVENCQE